MFKLYVIISIGLFLDLFNKPLPLRMWKTQMYIIFLKTLRTKKNVSLGRLEKVFRNGKK